MNVSTTAAGKPWLLTAAHYRLRTVSIDDLSLHFPTLDFSTAPSLSPPPFSCGKLELWRLSVVNLSGEFLRGSLRSTFCAQKTHPCHCLSPQHRWMWAQKSVLVSSFRWPVEACAPFIWYHPFIHSAESFPKKAASFIHVLMCTNK